MPYGSDFPFLCEILKKTHVNVGVLEPSECNAESLKSKLSSLYCDTERLLSIFSGMEERTLYRFTDEFDCTFFFLLLRPHDIMYVGPFLLRAVSNERIGEIADRVGASEQRLRHLAEYYSGLPIISEGNPILSVINTFCERMWNSPKFSVRDITDVKNRFPDEKPLNNTALALGPSDTLISMRTIERRYAFENEMMRSVSLGQSHLDIRFRRSFSDLAYEKRTSDSLRNAKNYAIIMNTLLRKAAETGGVHPMYLDRVSSEFAAKIENMLSLSESPNLMLDMYKTYCQLVKNHSSGKHSALVQRTVLLVESDLSTNLSPRTLAETQGVSLGYLSSQFRKETGETLSSYICRKRMEYAVYLLGKSDLQIQSIASQCGIMDVQYFTKLFKKHYGVPPSEYRKTISKNS